MEAKIIWLAVFVALFWVWCLFWGLRAALGARTASDYFIAGRRLAPWPFVLATTVASFAGWAFIGHPALISSDGFPYGYAALCAIAVPFAGLIFLKRQWIIGRRFGFVTPGEMLSYYFRSDAIRLLVLVVGVAFAVAFLAVQLRAGGVLLDLLSDGLLGVDAGMSLLAAVVLVYVAAGGLRAVAYVGSLQCILLVAGVVILAALTLHAIGSWDALQQHVAALAGNDAGRTPAGDGGSLAVPGMTPLVADGEAATGNAWAGVTILTFMLALMGIQSAPMFSMWAFSSRDPAPFAPQQVWASSLAIGVVLLLLAAIQGVGADALGAVPALAGPAAGQGGQDALVARLIGLVASTAPWLAGLLAVCALAALQATGAATSSAAGMLSRDLVRRFVMPNAGHGVQTLFGRIGVALIVLLALAIAAGATDALVLLGGLAVAYGFQMWPALVAVCYWPWLTRSGVVLGLIAGLAAVTLTDMPSSFGIEAWGRWPWTIHAAGWGIICNVAVVLIVSAISRDDMDRKMEFHNFLAQHAALPAARRGLIPVAWIVTLAWFFFGIGPGAVIGNWVFGDPNEPTGWMFGVPSISAWQLLFWALGVAMMWFLAYVMQMSTVPQTEVEALAEDIADIERARI